MIKKSLVIFLITLFVFSILLITYAIFIIPYKISTNTNRSYSTQIYTKFDDEIGYVPNSNLNSLVFLNYIDKTYKIITDKNGARIKDIRYSKNNYESEIIIIGGSFSFGYGVEYENTFAHLLEKYLDKKIKNFSVPGYGTLQSLKILNNNFGAEKLIIYGFIEDHLRRNVVQCGLITSYYCIKIPYVSLDKDGNLNITQTVGVNNVDLTHLMNQRLLDRDYFNSKDLYFGLKYMKDSFYERIGIYADKNTVEEKIFIFEKLINEIYKLIKKQDSKLLIVNLDFYLDKKIFNQISNSVVNDNIFFLDATLDEKDKNKISDLTIENDGHPNSNAHAYYVKKILEFIKKKDLLK
jgi:hypothetical protein